jgi:SAM-dependent methyltransferase
MTRWEHLSGHTGGAEYQRRFDQLAASGMDPHGEARFVAALAPPGARLLDAGCGTGRVAIRLAELGYDVTGVDVDPSMLAVARDRAPSLSWVLADLATLDVDSLGPAQFDVVVLAGNVIPLLAEGTVDETVQRMAELLAPGGTLVAGFGLDAAHLPEGCPVTALTAYERACARTDLVAAARFGTWDGTPFVDDGYVVSLHRRPLP